MLTRLEFDFPAMALHFLSLPFDIQDELLTYLNFPDLTRLRMTCRHMRDLPTLGIEEESVEDA